MTNVIIIDAFPVWREGIKGTIAAGKDIRIILESVDHGELRSAVSGGTADLVILDLDIPGGDGFELLRLVKDACSDVPVLIFSEFPEELYGVRALKEGAAGYLTKECTPQELLTAVRKVIDGKKYISDQLAQKLAKYVENGDKALPHERLTMRQFQVMLMLGQGMSPKEVAEKLSLSYTTVTTHKSRILSKMELGSVAQIVKYLSTEDLGK